MTGESTPGQGVHRPRGAEHRDADQDRDQEGDDGDGDLEALLRLGDEDLVDLHLPRRARRATMASIRKGRSHSLMKLRTTSKPAGCRPAPARPAPPPPGRARSRASASARRAGVAGGVRSAASFSALARAAASGSFDRGRRRWTARRLVALGGEAPALLQQLGHQHRGARRGEGGEEGGEHDARRVLRARAPPGPPPRRAEGWPPRRR